jgi:PhzF family phenazine biosynthesis protein
MTLQRVVHVGAFTDRPFAGNPAAVCVLEQPIDDTLMASIAAEMNLAETDFLQRLPGSEEWSLRWFTPEVEVDLCGHATLASAHANQSPLFHQLLSSRYHQVANRLR